MGYYTDWNGKRHRVRYQVAYKNWLGKWITCDTKHTRKTEAEKELAIIKQTKALNGQATIFLA